MHFMLIVYNKTIADLFQQFQTIFSNITISPAILLYLESNL